MERRRVARAGPQKIGAVVRVAAGRGDESIGPRAVDLVASPLDRLTGLALGRRRSGRPRNDSFRKSCVDWQSAEPSFPGF